MKEELRSILAKFLEETSWRCRDEDREPTLQDLLAWLGLK